MVPMMVIFLRADFQFDLPSPLTSHPPEEHANHGMSAALAVANGSLASCLVKLLLLLSTDFPPPRLFSK